MTRWRYRIATALAVAFLAVLAVATPADAHSRLQRTSPADGSAVTSPIDMVKLTFNEMVRGTFTVVVVNGPGGVSYSDGHVKVIDDDVFQAVYPLKSGAYTVAWRAISADGHPVDGQFHFSVSLPPGEEPTAGPPVAATGSSSGPSEGWFIWGGLAVALALAIIAFRLLARRRPVLDDQEPDSTVRR